MIFIRIFRSGMAKKLVLERETVVNTLLLDATDFWRPKGWPGGGWRR